MRRAGRVMVGTCESRDPFNCICMRVHVAVSPPCVIRDGTEIPRVPGPARPLFVEMFERRRHRSSSTTLVTIYIPG